MRGSLRARLQRILSTTDAHARYLLRAVEKYLHGESHPGNILAAISTRDTPSVSASPKAKLVTLAKATRTCRPSTGHR